MEGGSEIISEFLTESRESLERFDAHLLAIEKNPSDPENLTGVFRVVHTIKGACGFLGFSRLESLTHAAENLLAKLRDGRLTADAGLVSCLLKVGEVIREILDRLERGEPEGEGDDADLIAELNALQAEPDGPKQDWRPSPEHGAPRLGEILVEKGVVTPQEVEQALQEQVGADPARKRAARGDKTLRVDVSLLDNLMNLVGELVLIRNQVLQHAANSSSGDNRLGAASQHLNLITSELQESVMKTRMQPIRNVWNLFPRLVRELSMACGKSVRVEMEGEDTELDKTILEAVKDPLTHILRNSLDHGIEAPEVRAALGKPPEGRIFLKAYHKGGQVNIEISDDGAGIDCARVARKAAQKGLIGPEKLAKMGDRELAQLIFLPGFSTAEKVTHLSGRGVGMDVVKTSVEKIGGTVDLLNRPGQGLTLRVKIPLTLAIIPALIVVSSGRRFAIPQVNVLEVLRLKGKTAEVEWIQDRPVYRLRGDLLPLIRLESRVHPADSGPGENSEVPRDDHFIVVLQADKHHFGLLVHSVQDTQEIVVKPLSPHLKTASLFAGATIMGDGRVVLILDVPGLAQTGHLSQDAEEAPAAPASQEAGPAQKERFLIARLASGRLIAVPLSQVSRLEKIPAESLEQTAGLDVARCRGRLMPITRADGPESGTREAGGALNILVYQEGLQPVGVVVDQILDVVEEAAEIQLVSEGRGLRGSALIRGKATDILDLPSFVRLALPSVFKSAPEIREKA